MKYKLVIKTIYYILLYYIVMAKLNKKLFSHGWILLALLLLVGVAGSIYATPFVEGYTNNSNLFKQDSRLDCLEKKRGTLLGDWYPVHSPNPQFSNKNQEDQYKNYPILPSNSLYSNNTKYWREPSNGGCQPPGLCGAFYDKLNIELEKEPPQPPMSDVVNPRVNFYTSNPDRHQM